MVTSVEQTHHNEADRFISDVEKAKRARQEFAEYLSQMTQTLVTSEAEGEKASGRLGLEQDIADLNNVSENLRQGLFRLLVLGDMKRGKSTFLNALIGEKVLPADVNPCTAVLTIVRYGNDKQVTIHFNDSKSPETLDFLTFKQRYTIPPDEAKRLEEEGKQAFPDVNYAVVEYPLDILKNGVEFIDSPGLNDTEARNNLTLGYINNCHAILFVLSATQQCTKEERRYLENYLKDRGLTTFFLINGWDLIANKVDDEEEIEEAQGRIRTVFQSNLTPYCQVNGKNLYERRVFELNSLGALKARRNQPPGSLVGTGFDRFILSLDTFLTEERIIAELLKVKGLARQTYQHVHEAVERRLPLLDKGVEELRQKIKNVEPQFKQLVEIRDKFKDEIHTTSENYANGLADDFYHYFSNLSNTLETDFAPYQPNLKVFELLKAGKRKEFEQKLEQAFKQYFNDKMAAWSKGAEQKLKEAFSQLAQSAEAYGDVYSQITDKISEKLTGQPLETTTVSSEDKSPGWARWAGTAAGVLLGNYAGAALVGMGVLNWKALITQFITLVVANVILIEFFGVFLGGPIGMALAAMVVGPIQLAAARNQLIKTAKAEMKKSLPKIAKEQAWKVYNSVKEVFDNFEDEVNQRINSDIQSRKTELDELLAQKEYREIDHKKEVERLKALNGQIFAQWNCIEAAYDKLLEGTI
ncbi:dynamin [Hydrococcus rivularis NIES-593]|uniref:Dynamin n=1 Tax=Hydrococcus rivularis NIES-593 TaxID=1921803 RepID=A0A1U7H9E8_9CYAN|nr:dynamin family protein [Hydrococcus rivularis]OKH20206.1 dynamin [Hydrococcus rivularis NIES-593]